jgi:hypothetical protein
MKAGKRPPETRLPGPARAVLGSHFCASRISVASPPRSRSPRRGPTSFQAEGRGFDSRRAHSLMFVRERIVRPVEPDRRRRVGGAFPRVLGDSARFRHDVSFLSHLPPTSGLSRLHCESRETSFVLRLHRAASKRDLSPGSASTQLSSRNLSKRCSSCSRSFCRRSLSRLRASRIRSRLGRSRLSGRSIATRSCLAQGASGVSGSDITEHGLKLAVGVVPRIDAATVGIGSRRWRDLGLPHLQSRGKPRSLHDPGRREARRLLHEDSKVVAAQTHIFGNPPRFTARSETFQSGAQLNALAYNGETARFDSTLQRALRKSGSPAS